MRENLQEMAYAPESHLTRETTVMMSPRIKDQGSVVQYYGIKV